LKTLCPLPDLRTPDREPKHEDQLPEKRDKDESKMSVRIRVWPQFIDHSPQSIDCQQNPDYPGEVARPVNQVAQQTQMNSENHQGKRVLGIGIRKQREAGIHSETVTLMARGKPVQPGTLQKLVEFIVERDG